MKMLAVSLVLAVLAAVSTGAQVYPVGDLDEGRDVDFDDLKLLAERWLDESCLTIGCEADLDGSGSVNATWVLLCSRPSHSSRQCRSSSCSRDTSTGRSP